MIEQVSLRNYKCFASCEIPLGAITLLTGLNGTGKSSVIQSLLLLRQSYQNGMLPDVGLSLNGDLISIGKGQDALCEGSSSDEIEFNITITGTPKSWVFDYEEAADVLPLTSEVPSEVYGTHPLFSDDFQYLCAERLGPRTTYPTSEHQVGQHRQMGSQGEFASQFLHRYRNDPIKNTKLTPTDSSLNSLQIQVEAWLQHVCPGVRLNFVELPGTDLISLQYQFEGDRDTSRDFRPTNVGFGITYSLAIIVACLASPPGSLLLIENPEAHLHPEGQLHMGVLLALAAAGGVQVIVETHSDHVLNGVRLVVHREQIDPSNIRLHYFERYFEHSQEGGLLLSRIISPVIDQDGRIDPWPPGFFDQMDRALMELLGPRGLTA